MAAQGRSQSNDRKRFFPPASVSKEAPWGFPFQSNYIPRDARQGKKWGGRNKISLIHKNSPFVSRRSFCPREIKIPAPSNVIDRRGIAPRSVDHPFPSYIAFLPNKNRRHRIKLIMKNIWECTSRCIIKSALQHSFALYTFMVNVISSNSSILVSSKRSNIQQPVFILNPLNHETPERDNYATIY